MTVKKLRKLVGLYIYAIAYGAAFSLFNTPFVWAGWNYGLVNACSYVDPMSWSTAFWTCVLLHAVKMTFTSPFTSTTTTLPGANDDAATTK